MNYVGNEVTQALLRGNPMKKSLRLLFATIIMAAAVASAATSNSKSLLGAGCEPVPMCPPGVCAIN